MRSLQISDLATRDRTQVIAELFRDNHMGLNRGLHKLVSQVVYLLQTQQGSVRTVPWLGLDATRRLKTADLSDTDAVGLLVSEAVREVTVQLTFLNEGLPEDEQLDKLTVLDTRVTSLNTLEVDLDIVSLAGDSAEYSVALFG